MSLYQFLSSDAELKSTDNSQTEIISIDEVEVRGALMPNWYSKDMNISRTDKIVLFAPNEECFGEIEIVDDSDSEYAKYYSDKLYHSALRWTYSEKRARQLIEYITEHLKTTSEIELWHIWMDVDVKPTLKRCHIDSLSNSKLKQFNEYDPYENPQCLIIHR